VCVKSVVVNKKDKNATKLGYTVWNKYVVPCGKCPECLNRKCSDWMFRLDKELERSTNPLFITLTYATEHLTFGEISPTLVKRDTQLFFKNLRYKIEQKYGKETQKIKYFLVGEYGTRKGRPHYHIIMFNLCDVNLVHDAWGRGHTLSLPLRSGGTSYVLKYMFKPKKKEKGREPEFALMSKSMGENYLTPAMVKYHLSNEKNCFITRADGIKLPLPKYYKEKIYSEFTPVTRKQVTEYLQNRSEQNTEQALRDIQKRYPTRDKYFCIDILDNQKKNAKFTKRLTEVF